MLYTTPFLCVNGLEIRVTELREEQQDVEAFDRGGNLGMDGTIYATKRRWIFETQPVKPEDADSLVGWLEGRGTQFRFDLSSTGTTYFTQTAHDGAVMRAYPTAASTAATRASVWRTSVAKHGTWGLQLSGTSTAFDGTTSTYQFTYTAYTATFGLGETGKVSLSYWARNAASPTYTMLTTVWDVDESTSTALFYTGTANVLPDVNGLPWRSTSTFLATTEWCSFQLLSGASINSVSTTLFDTVLLVPYRLTTAMLAARNDRTVAEADLPYVYLSGHALQDRDEVEVKCLVEERRPTRCVIDGTWYDNAEIVAGVFVER